MCILSEQISMMVMKNQSTALQRLSERDTDDCWLADGCTVRSASQPDGSTVNASQIEFHITWKCYPNTCLLERMKREATAANILNCDSIGMIVATISLTSVLFQCGKSGTYLPCPSISWHIVSAASCIFSPALRDCRSSHEDPEKTRRLKMIYN